VFCIFHQQISTVESIPGIWVISAHRKHTAIDTCIQTGFLGGYVVIRLIYNLPITLLKYKLWFTYNWYIAIVNIILSNRVSN